MKDVFHRPSATELIIDRWLFDVMFKRGKKGGEDTDLKQNPGKKGSSSSLRWCKSTIGFNNQNQEKRQHNFNDMRKTGGLTYNYLSKKEHKHKVYTEDIVSKFALDDHVVKNIIKMGYTEDDVQDFVEDEESHVGKLYRRLLGIKNMCN